MLIPWGKAPSTRPRSRTFRWLISIGIGGAGSQGQEVGGGVKQEIEEGGPEKV